LKNSNVLHTFLLGWMKEAVSNGFYSLQDGSPSRESEVSSLTANSGDSKSDGLLDTISLSSDAIDDRALGVAMEAAVFAAYGAGMRRGRSHSQLWEDFSNIFQIARPQYFDAMEKARRKTDWTKKDDGAGSTGVGSGSGKTYNDEFASLAATAVAKKAVEFGFTDCQTDALCNYCLVQLQPDRPM